MVPGRPPQKRKTHIEKRKTYTQQALGAAGFERKKKIKHNGEEVVVDLPVNHVAVGPTAADMAHQCEGCHAYFSNLQGLGSHKNSCTLLRSQILQNAESKGVVFSLFKNPPPGSSSKASDTTQTTLEGGTIDENPVTASILLNEDDRGETKEEDEASQGSNGNIDTSDDTNDGSAKKRRVDGRKRNRGKSRRAKYTNSEKADLIHKLEMYLQDNPGGTVPDFVSEEGLDDKFKIFLSRGKGQWRHPDNMDRIMMAAASEDKKRLLRTGKVTLGKPKWPLMENALEQEIRRRRQRSARVSVNFIRTQAKQLMKQHYPEDSTFSASQGWILRFRKRKKIKFRRRQNKKKLNMEEKREDVSTKMEPATVHYTLCLF